MHDLSHGVSNMQQITDYLNKIIGRQEDAMQPQEIVMPGPEYFTQSKELIKAEKDLRFKLGIEACNIIGKVRSLIDRYIRRNGKYPRFGDILATETSKLSRNLNGLERIIKSLDNNQKRLHKAIDTSYRNAEEGFADQENYQNKISAVKSQLKNIEKILADQGRYSGFVYIRALRAKNVLMHRHMQYAKKQALGRARKDNETNSSKVLVKLKKVGYALEVNSHIRLLYYRTGQKTLAEIINTMEMMPEALRKSADIEENYSRIQKIAKTYQHVTGALMKLEAQQLEHSLGENAEPIMENDLL